MSNREQYLLDQLHIALAAATSESTAERIIERAKRFANDRYPVETPPAAAHGDGLHFKTVEDLAEAIRQVTAYEDMGPELIAEEMFKRAGAVETAHGDDAFVTVEQLQRWKDRFAQAQDFKFSTEVGKVIAAMRAQGDGGGS